MPSAATFGVLGGYGETGRIVVGELCKSDNSAILVGGRDLARAEALAGQFRGNVSAIHADAFEDASLDDFCRRCSIVVNCAAPVSRIQDRIAQAALRNRCHYIDSAGLAVVREGLLSHAREIEQLGLSFVISAGWIPGMTELIPRCAALIAGARMDAVNSVTVYFGDSGEYSTNAMRDAVWFVRRSRFRLPGYFRRGEWHPAKFSQASVKVDLGAPIGIQRFSLWRTPESAFLAQQLNSCDLFVRPCVPGFRAVLESCVLMLFPLPERIGVWLIRDMVRGRRLPVEGFVIAEIVGTSQGNRCVSRVQVVYGTGRAYWMNAIVVTTGARWIARGGTAPGVHYLSGAVDPVAFLSELHRSGVEVSETPRQAAQSNST